VFADIAPVYDLLKSHRDYAAEAAVVRGFLQQEVPQARSVLEVACGTGSLLAELGEYHRTGLDISTEMLGQAQLKIGDTVSLYQADMRDFSLPKTDYDALLCIDCALGYLSESDLAPTMANFARHLTPGGLLVLEPWYGPDDWQPGRIHVVQHRDAANTVIRVGYGYPDGTIEFHSVVGSSRGIHTFDERYELTLHTPSSITAALCRAGFADIRRTATPCFRRGLFVARRS